MTGGLYLKGTVYEWVDAPGGATSRTYFDQDVPAGGKLVPTGATLYTGRKIVKDKSLEGTLWWHTPPTSVGSNGTFDVFMVVSPRQDTWVVQAEKEGYQPVFVEWVNRSRSKHELNVILVRNQ